MHGSERLGLEDGVQLRRFWIGVLAGKLSDKRSQARRGRRLSLARPQLARHGEGETNVGPYFDDDPESMTGPALVGVHQLKRQMDLQELHCRAVGTLVFARAIGEVS